jgi:hypothetical protein
MSWQDDPVVGAPASPNGPQAAWMSDPVVTPSAAPAAAPSAPDPSAGGGTLRPFGIDTGIQTPESVDRFLAGAGKAFADLGRGAGQLLGVVDNEAITESRQLDAPLMATTAGTAGNIAGNVAATVPAAFIPGANTVAGAGAIGAGVGLLQPAESGTERLTNTAFGGAAGSAGQAIGGRVAQYAQRKLSERAATAASNQAQNSVRDDLLKQARQAGYVTPPATTNPTATNRVIEGVSGKAQTQQSAAVKNQTVTNRLVRDELGLAKDSPITKAALNGVRSKAGQVYKAINKSGRIAVDDDYLDDLSKLSASIDSVSKDFPDANVGSREQIDKLVNSLLVDDFEAPSAMAYIKELRQDASSNLSFAASADPAKRALGHAQRDAAGALEDMVIRHLQNNGQDALANSFDQARTLIAKTYSVEAALNEGTGNVVATQLASQLKRGKPLTGNLGLIARFGQSFPKAAAEVRDSPGVSALDVFAGAAAGLGVDPSLIALPLARVGTRGALLSDAGQMLATPNYNPNLLGTGSLKALDASGRRAGAISSAYTAQKK